MRQRRPRTEASERRRSPRVSERVPLAITDGGAPIQAETVNLSAAGAYCTLDRFLAPMTKLQLDYELPDPPGGGVGGGRRVRIRCAGVVVRSEPVIVSPDKGRYHVAIFFTDLSERNRSVLSRFVRQRLSRPSTS
ncbi:MAG: hypothetical protein A3B78_03460 [Omnitrophica WOR_2 bacterium RIFCSPHIGHO2_02_FULL_67_20]|nr:MAG: hypothetical protein A3B78_03460 [Omnitrophica WOR_2 bacterium RIFCSPHIGHO2_02_FULL_67_20]